MSIFLKKLTPRATEWQQVKALYITAFPAQERAPFFIMKRRALQGKGDFWVIKEGEVFIGLAYVVRMRDLVYLFYFAIASDKRGQGYGSAVLQALQKEYPVERIFLAREELDSSADNYAQRVKRRAFYQKNGFVDLPCQIKEANVVYDVMGLRGGIQAQEYEQMMRAWMGPVLRRLIDMRMLEKE